MKFKIKIPTNGRGGVPLKKSDAKAVVNLAKSVERFLQKHQERMKSRIQQQMQMTGGMNNAQSTGRAIEKGGREVREPGETEAEEG